MRKVEGIVLKMGSRPLLYAVLVAGLLSPLTWAAERGALVREAVIYLTPNSDSQKLGNAERGREVIIMETSRNWLHVEALLGSSRPADPAFIYEEEDQEKTVSGWIVDKGVIRSSTADGDRILYGEAADSEDEASRRRGRRGAAADALRLYRRVYDYFPASPLAGEALYRAADIRWQLEKEDVMTRPSARAKESYLREGMNEEWMKLVIKKYPNTKWADMAAYNLIDNKLCGDWQGSSKCPDKEADMYEKFANEHTSSPATAAQALYNAAWRRSALIEIYKTEEQSKKSEESKNRALALAQKVVSQYAQQTDWVTRAQRLIYLIQQNIPTYGSAAE